MEFNAIKDRPSLDPNVRATKRYLQFKALIAELTERVTDEKIIETINYEIDDINEAEEAKLGKVLRRAQNKIARLLEKELKLVTKNYYRAHFIGIGMSIGVGIGVGIGTSNDNMGLIGVGIPIGMAIGIAMGAAMDKKAAAKGLQLKTELKY